MAVQVENAAEAGNPAISSIKVDGTAGQRRRIALTSSISFISLSDTSSNVYLLKNNTKAASITPILKIANPANPEAKSTNTVSFEAVTGDVIYIVQENSFGTMNAAVRTNVVTYTFEEDKLNIETTSMKPIVTEGQPVISYNYEFDVTGPIVDMLKGKSSYSWKISVETNGEYELAQDGTAHIDAVLTYTGLLMATPFDQPETTFSISVAITDTTTGKVAGTAELLLPVGRGLS